MHRLCHRITRRARKHRHRQQARTDNAEREQREGEGACERAQRLGGLRCRRNRRQPRLVQRRRRGDHDAKRDAIRERHADAGIHRHASQMVPRVGCLCEEGVLAHKLHVLDFLRRLPEKDIGADRRSEHRNNC